MSSTHFNCLDCKQLLPTSMMSFTKKDRCTKDVASYKSLCDKWGRVRQLRAWWAALAAEQKVEWFRKHQRAEPGTKRRFDDCEYKEKSETAVADIDDEVDMAIPWWRYRDEQVPLGKSLVEVQLEWQRLVDAPGSGAFMRRGEWVLPRFYGVELRKRKSESNSMETSRAKRFKSAEEHAELRAGGQALLDRYTSTIKARSGPSDSVEMPEVERSVEDCASLHVAQDMIGPAADKEVFLFGLGPPSI